MKKLLLYILLVGAVVWFAGFLAFNYRINSYRPDEKTRTDAIIALTGGKPTYFITIRMPYPWQENNNNTMLREAAKKNKNVGIIDWHGYSEGHSEYLNDDGIHPNMTGAYAYATMIRQAVCGQ